MKILAVLANYGTKNDTFLRRVVEEYRGLPYRMHIVVLTNIEKKVAGADEIVLHQPKGDPWTFPFAHKAILAGRASEHDLFVYSEDDTLITRSNIEAFLSATDVLREDEIAGFLRVERTPAGDSSVCTINGHFRWDPVSVVKRGRHVFAHFTNEHAASYLLTRGQLRRAIGSRGFLVQPHQEKYDLLVTAATDPYTQCGFRKLVCISEIGRFLVSHLPNKYVGQFGVPVQDLERQVEALLAIANGTRPPTVLLPPESRVRHQLWSKCAYSPPRRDVVDAVAGRARTVLSYGCGHGDLEAELKKRGLAVTAAPLDCVLGACVEARGIETVYGDADSIWRSLGDRRFDCIVALDLLHLVRHPGLLLERFARILNRDGAVVASVPNILSARTVWKSFRGETGLVKLHDYDRSGVQPASAWAIRRWFTGAGLAVSALTPVFAPDGKPWQRAAGRVFPQGFASEFLVVGEKGVTGNGQVTA